MIDRVVHHADVVTLEGASYCLRNRGIDTCPASETKPLQTKTENSVAPFSTAGPASHSSVVDTHQAARFRERPIRRPQ
jgi:hypothetical protein